MEHISKHLTVVNQELAPPESKPLENGELGLCLAEPRIKNLADLTPLREALRYVMLLVGLRANNLPKDEEKAVLISFIVENYGGHTVSEIKLAFKMAVGGKLEAEPNCYENFSVMYFAGIMNAYREWAKQEVKQIKTPPVELPPARITDEEFIDSVRSIYKLTQDFRQIPVLAYKCLNLQLTVEEKEAIKTAVNGLIDEPTNDNYKQFSVKLYFDELG